MTRKDYVILAEAICEARVRVARETDDSNIIGGANAGLYELARILSARFFEENPRFDDNRWMVATKVLEN